MIARLILLIMIISFCDIWLVVMSATYLNISGAFLLCVLSAIIGGYLFKREGLKVVKEFKNEISGGKLPGNKLADGVMIIVGGTLLMTPGFITDIIGFMLLIPISRKLIGPIVLKYAKNQIKVNISSQILKHTQNESEKEVEIIDVE
ncbi:MAG: FxsA protein [Planctomycetota bacterium]|nr:MAG: FxsA protein [Planctomycetota bacterium]